MYTYYLNCWQLRGTLSWWITHCLWGDHRSLDFWSIAGLFCPTYLRSFQHLVLPSIWWRACDWLNKWFTPHTAMYIQLFYCYGACLIYFYVYACILVTYLYIYHIHGTFDSDFNWQLCKVAISKYSLLCRYSLPWCVMKFWVPEKAVDSSCAVAQCSRTLQVNVFPHDITL